MRKLRVYIDTSVVGGCHDPEFAQESLALFGMARDGEIVLVLSDLLADELIGAPDHIAGVLASVPNDSIELVERSDEAYRLQESYLAAGILGHSSADDALHVALATIGGADVIVSWNFRHIVHLDKIRKFNAVNALEGYSLIEIRSPKEVV